MPSTPSVKLHNSLPSSPAFFRQLGPRPGMRKGENGWLFRLWAPEAAAISVAGDFNNWNPTDAPMEQCDTGLWECFLPQSKEGELYKYVLYQRDDSYQYYSDPWAVSTEAPPGTASRLFDLSGYPWRDGNWLRFRHRADFTHHPQLLYHLHLHTWRRSGDGQPLSCRELTTYLVPYLKEMGYTGAVLVADNTPFFAPPAAQDTPHDWMYLIDQLHQAGLSAFLDWHPGRCPVAYSQLLPFPGLGMDRTASDLDLLDWSNSAVRAFLTASATFWLEQYHLDGLRIDTPDPVHYLNGSGWDSFFSELQASVAQLSPDTVLLLNSPASVPHFSGWQERSALPLMDLFQGKASAPCEELASCDLLAFPAQCFHAPLPSFLSCFSGTHAEQRAAARACYLAFLALPGGKLISMGTELGQHNGWHSNVSLDWHLLNQMDDQAHHAFFQVANTFYLTEPSLWADETSAFQWLPLFCGERAMLAFLRRDSSDSGILCLCNPTPTPFSHGVLSLPDVGTCHILLSSDEKRFGGAGTCSVTPEQSGSQLQIHLPPTTCVLIRYIPARRRDPQGAPPSDGPHSR